MTAVALPILLLVAFGPGDSPTTAPLERNPNLLLLPAGPPTPQVVALQGNLRIYLPIAQGRITAIGYHGVGDGALRLDPVGSQANAGLFTRLINKLFGQDSGGLRYYLLEGGAGPGTGGLDVGAPVDTNVYAPVDGTVIGISDQVLNGRRFGVRIDIQPSGSPGLVVSLSNLEPDPALEVGSTVSAARSKIGRVIDLSSVQRSALARYTQDNGQHVLIQAHPAVNLSVP